MASQYTILASFQGSAQIIAQFRHIQNEARRTSRTMIEGSRSEARAAQDARRRESQATRDAQKAVNDYERANRRMFQERERLRREDLAAQRRYEAAIQKEKSDAEAKRQKSLRMMGAGVIGLGITAGGIKLAADFESSMTELRLSIARAKDGAVDMQMLTSQMADLEKLAVKLGNTLPGTTKDFVDLFISLKQGGMATEDILGGAGEAIANLAVLTHSVPADLGKQFAQMGQMFKLKPEEYKAAVEQFHALYRMGVDPTELIESAKFFAPRAAAPLGMTGIEGMTQAGSLLGALNRAGLGGGLGGRQISSMMNALTFSSKPQQKMIEELKGKGIDLQFFDTQGRFSGIENMTVQLEKLKKLNPKEQMEALDKLFTEAGSSAASNVILLGAEGMRKYVEESKGVIDSQTAINELQKDFAQRWEALKGTGQNVFVRLFTPVMTALKPVLQLTNELFGYLEGLAKTNPGLAKFLTTFIGLGSVAMIAKGGIGALTASTRIWQLTARLAALENTKLAASNTAVGTTAATAGTRMGRFASGLKAVVGMAALVVGSQLLEYIMRLREEAEAAWAETGAAGKGEAGATQRLYAAQGVSPDRIKQMGEVQSASALKQLTDAYEKKNESWFSGTDKKRFPYAVGGDEEKFDVGKMREMLRLTQPRLDMPSQYAMFHGSVMKSDLSQERKAGILAAMEQEFPKANAAFFNMLESATSMDDAIKRLIAADKDAAAKAEAAASKVDTLGTAASRAADELNKIKAGVPPVPELPKLAGGGDIARTGPAIVHRGERVVPAHLVARGYNVQSQGARAVNLHYAPTVNIGGGAGADIAEQVRAVLASHKQDLIRTINEEFRDRALSI